MRKPFIKVGLMLMAIGLLAGCGRTSEDPVSSQDPTTSDPTTSQIEDKITDAEFAIAVDVIAKEVPLAIEKSAAQTIPTNTYRKSFDPEQPVPVLKDGNAIILTTGGTLNIEDEENEVYLYNPYTISWSYRGQGDETSTLAHYTFENDAEGKLNAIPGYPTYKPEFDASNNPIHVIPADLFGRLYATVKIDDKEAVINIDMWLKAIEKIEYSTLLAVRELEDKTVVMVRGYVTGVFADWNAAGIGDGEWGLGLYRLDLDFKNAFQVGDLVEVVGKASNYNGLAQIGFIKSVKVLDPTDFPEIEKPAIQEYSLDDLKDQLGRASTDLTGPLQDKDNSIIKFTAPFKFVRVEDRNGVDVGFAGFDVTGSTHTNVVLEGKTSADVTFEVKLSINYHMGAAEQTLFKNFLEVNQAKEFYYTGPLSAYNELVLGPYAFEGTFELVA